MRVIVHTPKEEAARRELAIRVAQSHGDAVMRFIRGLPCSKEQKVALIQAILDSDTGEDR